jgi:murein DD-endopeptidase MepM/ murein hydrolase activator NlpD
VVDGEQSGPGSGDVPATPGGDPPVALATPTPEVTPQAAGGAEEIAIEELSVEPPPVEEPRPALRTPTPERVSPRTPTPPRASSPAPSAPRVRTGWGAPIAGARRTPVPADVAIRPAPALARSPIPHGGRNEAPPAAPRLLGGTGRTPPPPPADVPLARPGPSPHLSPRMTAVFGGIFGLATVTSIVALLIQVVPPKDERAAIASAAASASGAPVDAPRGPKKRVRVALPSPWRVADLEKDTSVRLVSDTMERRSFITALGDKDIPKAQIYRIMKAFDGVRKFDRAGRKDKFVAALDRATKRVKAFEYEESPSEIYQAREDDKGLLVGGKLDMKIAAEEVAAAFYVGKDVTASYRWVGLEDGILPEIDDALSGRASSDSFEEGAVVKVIATEETALGLFSHYQSVSAVEYRPADPSKKAIRVYAFKGTQAKGFIDERGKYFGGGWRAPIAGAPITSRFNPKRMHPVLHKIISHTGTDFGAAMGTPIYSAFHGTVSVIGPLGRCGNAVEIEHPNGVLTGYCHMSRFAPGLKVGDKVGTHQLVGYVGMTGSATGPHLHFFAKKDGKFFDAETLHLDGEHVLPPADRPAFLERKAELDKRLDAIEMPEPMPEPKAPEPSPTASASAAAAASSAGPSDVAARAPSTSEPSTNEPSAPAARPAAPVATNVPLEDGGIHPGTLQEDDSIDDGDDL